MPENPLVRWDSDPVNFSYDGTPIPSPSRTMGLRSRQLLVRWDSDPVDFRSSALFDGFGDHRSNSTSALEEGIFESHTMNRVASPLQIW